MIRLLAALTIALTLALTASTALTDALVARCWWPGMAGACDFEDLGAPEPEAPGASEAPAAADGEAV